jgi:predicted DCC family thiol-disulfide oxidoreductase YuxK
MTAGPMLIFDGDCGFCTSSARWIEKRLPTGVEVIAWQFIDDLDALGLTVAEVSEKAWWIDGEGLRHGGHLAIGEALAAAGGVWGVVGRGMLLPPFRWLAAPVYRLISRYRHRMPGGTPACRLDTRR